MSDIGERDEWVNGFLVGIVFGIALLIGIAWASMEKLK